MTALMLPADYGLSSKIGRLGSHSRSALFGKIRSYGVEISCSHVEATSLTTLGSRCYGYLLPWRWELGITDGSALYQLRSLPALNGIPTTASLSKPREPAPRATRVNNASNNVKVAV